MYKTKNIKIIGYESSDDDKNENKNEFENKIPNYMIYKKIKNLNFKDFKN